MFCSRDPSCVVSGELSDLSIDRYPLARGGIKCLAKGGMLRLLNGFRNVSAVVKFWPYVNDL